MKLTNYYPTWRWVLLEPIVEDMIGNLYIPAKAQRAETYRVTKVGPQCETVSVGDCVIVELGPTIDISFEDSRQLYKQVLEPRIVGIEKHDSIRDPYQSEPTLPGSSVEQEGCPTCGGSGPCAEHSAG